MLLWVIGGCVDIMHCLKAFFYAGTLGIEIVEVGVEELGGDIWNDKRIA
jgi:hypothetical protein